MPKQVTKSFLEFAQAETELFVQDALPCEPEIRKALISLLAGLPGLTEEGNQVWAFIIVTSNMKELKDALAIGFFQQIGTMELVPESFKIIFKSLAPVCKYPWYGWIHIDNELGKVEYGVVSCENSQISIPLEDHLRNEESWPKSTILASPITSSILLLESNKNSLKLSFSLKEINDDKNENVRKIAKDIVSAIEKPEQKNLILKYINKLILLSVNESHGCIIGVVDFTKIDDLKKELKSVLWLDTPIDFKIKLNEYQEAKSVGGDATLLDSQLRLYGELICNMMNQDGIVLFDNQARFLAYRAFVISNDSNGSDGGARLRAFNNLVMMKSIQSALFRSQDGNTRMENGGKGV